MSIFSFYRWNQFKVWPTLRTRKLPKFSSGHAHRSFNNNITGNWVTDLHVTSPNALPQTNFPFQCRNAVEVNNFAIRTWNVVLVSECRFVSENVVFVSEIWFDCGRSFGFGNLLFTLEMPLNSGILRSGSTKCHFWLRKPFLSAIIGSGFEI